MAVIANAGPLIALARVRNLHLLPVLYNEIIVPSAVYGEITAEIDLPGAKDLQESDWFRVKEVHDRASVERLLFWLDKGESEAIILAREMNGSLLIDERRGRAIAITMGLNVTGTVGILLAAKTQGHIQLVTPLLDALLSAGVRLSMRLYEEAQLLAGEKPTVE